MDVHVRARFRAQAKVLKAMAHATRLFILQKLSEGERCVCELTEMIGADISTVSKHLAVLRNAGLLEDRKEGARVFYSLTAPCCLNFSLSIDSFLKTAAEENLRLTKP